VCYFAKGINPGKVNLTENTKEGMLYYAVLHTDDGDKKFDAKKDMELKGYAKIPYIKIKLLNRNIDTKKRWDPSSSTIRKLVNIYHNCISYDKWLELFPNKNSG
jgi:hypothetical protein